MAYPGTTPAGLEALNGRIIERLARVVHLVPSLSEPFFGMGTFYKLIAEAAAQTPGHKVALVNAYEMDKRFSKFYQEIDRHTDVYKLKDQVIIGDMLGADTKSLEDSVLVVGGPECKAWALNGLRRGVEVAGAAEVAGGAERSRRPWRSSKSSSSCCGRGGFHVQSCEVRRTPTVNLCRCCCRKTCRCALLQMRAWVIPGPTSMAVPGPPLQGPRP